MTALFSPCRTWRYSLTRDLGAVGGGICTFVMLNPSTADEVTNDPSVRRCIRFARDWGFSQLNVANLYAFRATDPRALKTADDPVGPENDHALRVIFDASDRIVAAWGCHARPERVAEVMSWTIRPNLCLALTKDGAPRHPLYVRADTEPIPFGVS